MIQYIRTKVNRSEKEFWYLEVDTKKEKVIREIEFDKNGSIIRKAPTHEDNYGCYTDNLNVIIAPKLPKYKETIIIDPKEKYITFINKEEFEEIWRKHKLKNLKN